MRPAPRVFVWDREGEEVRQEADEEEDVYDAAYRCLGSRLARLPLAACGLLLCAAVAAGAARRSPVPVPMLPGGAEEASSSILQRYQITTGRPVPTRCLKHKPADSTYSVALIFAGRKNVMSLLVRYLDVLIQDCALHEVHMWDYSRNDADRAWLKEVSAHPGFQLMTGVPQRKSPDWGYVYRYYTSSNVSDGSEEPRFRPRWPLATNDTTVLIKMDDDTIFLDTDNFANFTEWVRTHPEKFLVHANVVNNGVAAYYQGQHFTRIVDNFPELKKYPYSHGTPGLEGDLLWDSYISSNLLWMFVVHPKMFSWRAPDADDCVMFEMPEKDLPRTVLRRPAGQGRFSVNFFGVRWARWGEVNQLVKQEHGNDEHALTTVATALQPTFAECMYTPFNVVHFSFGGQRHPQELVEVYRSLLPPEVQHPNDTIELRD